MNNINQTSSSPQAPHQNTDFNAYNQQINQDEGGPSTSNATQFGPPKRREGLDYEQEAQNKMMNGGVTEGSDLYSNFQLAS